MEFSDLANTIRSRRSIRRWEDKEVPEDLLLQAIELATWAPNGGNQQNWHFYIILNRDTIRAIADAVQATAKTISSWPSADKFVDTARLGERATFFRNAPVAIAVAAARYQSPIDRLCAAQGNTNCNDRCEQSRQPTVLHLKTIHWPPPIAVFNSPCSKKARTSSGDTVRAPIRSTQV